MSAPPRRADLHLHTWYSDGLYAPAEIVARARAAGLSAIAISDHETVAGIGEAEAAGTGSGIEIIPGIEFAAQFKKVEVHLLGLWIDRRDPDLTDLLQLLQVERQERAETMVSRLQELGVKLTMEDVLKEVGKGGIGRPHLAIAVVKVGGAATVQKAFTRYLAAGRPAYVPRRHLTPDRAIEIIHRAGGKVVLAHPLIGGPQREHVRELVNLGLDALEYCHPKLSPAESAWLEAFARERGLGLTAGSDYHGPGISDGEIGNYSVDWELVEELYNRKSRG